MQLKQLLNEDRAVSPVIGVILMVAITVILAAVIGTFVLGLGSGLQSSAPQATFEANTTDVSASGSNVKITHSTGDSLENTTLSFKGVDAVVSDFQGTVSAGDTAVVTASEGSTVRIVWTSDQGDNSATLQKWEMT